MDNAKVSQRSNVPITYKFELDYIVLATCFLLARNSAKFLIKYSPSIPKCERPITIKAIYII